MLRFGPTELIIILIIVILLFGVGRISKIAGELGSGIKAFRKGIQSDEKDDVADEKTKEDNAEKSKEE
ncbi:MAG: preprotein translocase subunit TatA [Chloroflexi bacterium RBG_16_52_11]|nr:MAG: preprotein translocase subunit TatA [Chloroflexi bacterium RBG_16_52_11]